MYKKQRVRNRRCNISGVVCACIRNREFAIGGVTLHLRGILCMY